MRVVAWTSLGRYIDSLERDGELLRITREVDVELEAGTIADLLVKTGGPAVIFEKPRLPDGTISDIPLAMNIFGSHSRTCLLYTSPSPRDKRQSRMPSSA